MDLNQFKKTAKLYISKKQSPNNHNTNILSKVYTKQVLGVDLKLTRESLINDSKIVSNRFRYQVNGIGVCKRKFKKTLNLN